MMAGFSWTTLLRAELESVSEDGSESPWNEMTPMSQCMLIMTQGSMECIEGLKTRLTPQWP